TWAHTLDDQSGFRYNSSLYTDPFNHALDRASANFDVRQRLVISGIWKLPLERTFGGKGFAHKLASGWEMSGIASFQTGTPFTIFSESGSSENEIFLDRADKIGPIHYFPARSLHSFDPSTANCLGQPIPDGHFYFDPTAFDCANVPLFSFGDSGRNILRGPGRNGYDLSVGRTFQISESKSVEFRSEFFNAFNHAQFFNPDHFGFDANFGQITQARDPRIIQFALKFYF